MRRWLTITVITAVFFGGFGWLAWNGLSRAVASEAFFPADLVVNGKVVPDKAGFWGLSGQPGDFSVEALVTALGGKVEKVGGKDPNFPDYAILTLNGKRLVLYTKDRPPLQGSDIIWEKPETWGTLSSLGWDWGEQDVERYLRLVYSDVTITSTFDWKHRELRKIVVTTKP